MKEKLKPTQVACSQVINYGMSHKLLTYLVRLFLYLTGLTSVRGLRVVAGILGLFCMGGPKWPALERFLAITRFCLIEHN